MCCDRHWNKSLIERQRARSETPRSWKTTINNYWKTENEVASTVVPGKPPSTTVRNPTLKLEDEVPSRSSVASGSSIGNAPVVYTDDAAPDFLKNVKN